MDVVQAVNGVAALVAFSASMFAFLRFHDGQSRAAQAVHILNGTLLLWYATVNLSLGFGLWDADQADLRPLFRWAFAPLLFSYTARQLLAGRRQRQGEIL
jgi:hypothetical protein